MKRAIWVAVTVAAVLAIALLAAHGRRPEPGLVRFEAAGVMLAITPERVTQVVLSAGDHRWTFRRLQSGEWVSPAGEPPPTDEVAARLESGLRFLHVSAPQRVLTAHELAGTPPGEFGLDPPGYTVVVYIADTPAFSVEFGAANPLGLGQYARVRDRSEVFLLPRFVGEQWEALTAVR